MSRWCSAARSVRLHNTARIGQRYGASLEPETRCANIGLLHVALLFVGAHRAIVEGRSLCAAGANCTSGAPLISHDNGVGEPVIAESSEAFTPELAGRVEDTGAKNRQSLADDSSLKPRWSWKPSVDRERILVAETLN